MRCNICYLPIQEERSKESCPRCFNHFHRDHFAAWLLKHDYCPMCREQLSVDFRDDLKPKSERERKRLEQTLARLDGLGATMRQFESKERKRIMASRAEEFGIVKTSLGDIIKIAAPVILLLLSVMIMILALSS